MTDKLTDAEVKKALEVCIDGYCRGCCYGDTDQRHCRDDLMQEALDLINRQEVRIHQQEKTIMEIQNANLIDFKATIGNYISENECLKAEVERLKRELNLVVENSLSARLPHCVLRGDRCAILTEDLTGYDKLIAEIKAEAYKEFAERLDKEFSGVGTCNYGCVHHKTRKVLKELVGDGDGKRKD